MSDTIKHECGLAMVRLLKPIQFYTEKYGTPLYGLNKMQLLLQKQRNRGQDGAGLATIKLNVKPGNRYISRKRSNASNYIADLFHQIYAHFDDVTPEQLQDANWLKHNKPYIGEVYLGHLRYGTHGLNTIETCHPFLRLNNWITRNLVIAGNFNLTNVNELFQELLSFGQHPKEKSDTVTVMEKIGHFLDDEVQRLFNWFKAEGYDNDEITQLIGEHLDVARLLQRASRKFDGGYVMAGMIGHGDAFVMKDSGGIRPAFYYQDDEIVVVASERPAIQTCMGVHISKVKEIGPGNALIIKKNGTVSEVSVKDPDERRSCSFERIYFSRGTDRDIYFERKKLGQQLAKQVLEAVNYDTDNTIFSFIPNTAEVAYYGLIEGINEELDALKKRKILEKPNMTEAELDKIMSIKPRVEKIAVKDAKMRTFIADDASREDLVSRVYDVTYGLVKNKVDTLVMLDDSIVRGTTLKKSILKILDTLQPKKIIIVSSAPQIRYPDCYGIDMSKMKEFVAFRALVNLIKKSNQEHLLGETYERCEQQMKITGVETKNEVQALYDLFTLEELNEEIARIVTPPNLEAEVEVIYQTIDGLHQACPDHTGDWYFSGNYPTAGGFRVVNKSFMNYIKKIDKRAYF